jgi:hypothetical protein
MHEGHELQSNKQHEIVGDEHKIPDVRIPDETSKWCG